MSRTIVIQGQIIEFPEPGQEADWGQAVEDFAEAVEEALEGVAGTFDVPPQIMNIDGASYNPTASPVDITNLSFSASTVRAVIINIAVKRSSTTDSLTEFTVLHAVYNASNSPSPLWEMSRETTGNGGVDFTITDTGQVQFATTTTLGGANPIGILSYSAKALLNS